MPLKVDFQEMKVAFFNRWPIPIFFYFFFFFLSKTSILFAMKGKIQRRVTNVKEHDMYIEPKSYKFKLLVKLVIQHSIRTWFGKRF